MGRAAELLRRRGYRLRHRSAAAGDAVHLTTEYHFVFDSPQGLPVELHGEAIPCYLSFPLTNEELMARQEAAVVAGRLVPSLSREDMALLLAMHGTKHEWQCLELVLALAGVVQARPALRWDVLMERAGKLGARRILLLALNLTETLFGCELPGAVREAIARDRVVGRLTTQVWEYYAEIRRPATSAVQTLRFQELER